MKKIALFNINRDEGKYQELNKNFTIAVKEKGFKCVSFASDSISDMTKIAGNEADKIFVSIDATEGITSDFSKVSKELYKVYSNDIYLKPNLIVTSSDDPKSVFLKDCEDSLEDLWTEVTDDDVGSDELFFKTIYYSYIKHSFGMNPKVFDYNSIEELLKLL